MELFLRTNPEIFKKGGRAVFMLWKSQGSRRVWKQSLPEAVAKR